MCTGQSLTMSRNSRTHAAITVLPSPASEWPRWRPPPADLGPVMIPTAASMLQAWADGAHSLWRFSWLRSIAAGARPHCRRPAIDGPCSKDVISDSSVGFSCVIVLKEHFSVPKCKECLQLRSDYCTWSVILMYFHWLSFGNCALGTASAVFAQALSSEVVRGPAASPAWAILESCRLRPCPGIWIQNCSFCKLNFEVVLDLQNSCKNCLESFSTPFTYSL